MILMYKKRPIHTVQGFPVYMVKIKVILNIIITNILKSKF